MGCDIHLYAEIKPRRTIFNWSPKWRSINVFVKEQEQDKLPDVPSALRTYTHGRNYNLFCALCGVRKYHFYGDPPSISEPRGIPQDSDKRILALAGQWGSDGHSHNYNTLEELKSFNWSSYGETCNEFLNEVLPKLQKYADKGHQTRIVYWFDN